MKTIETKFRGKRIDNGDWVYGYFFKTPLTDENSGTPPENGWFFLTGEERYCISNEHGTVFVVDPETVGMSTGRTTENTHPMFYDIKELFEGDVFTCEHSQTKFVTTFKDFGWIGISDEEDAFGPYTINLYSIRKHKIKILGNIHDNKNIMKSLSSEVNSIKNNLSEEKFFNI